MKYLSLGLVCIVLFIGFPFFSTAYASCSFEKKYIVYEAVNRQIGEILKDIEKKITYKITFEDAQFLKNKITINFDTVPLDEVFHRLLKKQNYSVICDDKEKNITLIIYAKNKEDIPYTTSGEMGGEGNNVPTSSLTQGMAGASAAFEEYNDNGGKAFVAASNPLVEETEMSGAAVALEEFKNDKKNQNYSVQEVEETEMSGTTIALEEYALDKKQQVNTASLVKDDIEDEPAVAFKEYKRNINNQPCLLSPAQVTEMDGVSAALDEYKQTHQK